MNTPTKRSSSSLKNSCNAAGITLQKAQVGQLQKEIVTPGKITLNEDLIAHIHPKVEGVVHDVRKNLGESVERDEVLATLESREIAEAKTGYLTALKKAEQAKTLLGQESNLYEIKKFLRFRNTK